MFLFISLLALFSTASFEEQNDSIYYFKVTQVRNYMNSDRTSTAESWVTNGKSCILTSQRKIITRNDLGLTYTINLQTKTYRVDQIRTKMTQSPSIKEDNTKYAGINYTPVYEWKQASFINKETVCGNLCDHFSLKGDADFDRASLDYFIISSENKSLPGMINSILIDYLGVATKKQLLLNVVEKEKTILILKIIDKVENAIAPPITSTYTVDIIRKIPADNGMFDPPADYKKTN